MDLRLSASTERRILIAERRKEVLNMSEPGENDSGRTIGKRFADVMSRQKAAVAKFRENSHISRNTNQEFNANLTFGERVADKVAAFGGSWTFIGLFAAIMFLWVVLNSFLLVRRGDAFDPYPYILLNLFLSMLAAIQAPVIMMSQNRQAEKDRLDAENDYQVNLKSELEIMKLHEKLDDLREKKWIDLIDMQQTQIRVLSELLKGQNNDAATLGSKNLSS
jgi:uncharacterized membrane protein